MMQLSAYLNIVFIIAIILFAKKLKWHPLWLYGIGLGLLWQTTILGVGVVGPDIQREVLMSRMALENGWNLAYPWEQSNTSIVVGLIVPFISRLTTIDVVWIYKIILPLFLAGVPVILYYTYKHFITDLQAFYASVFFMIMPVFNTEMAEIGKSMVAEVFLALLVLSTVTNWKWQVKLPTMIISLLLAILCHYTVGIIALIYLIGILICRIIGLGFFRAVKIWQFPTKIPIWIISLTLVVGILVGYFYYSYACGGEIVDVVLKNFGAYSKITAETRNFLFAPENADPSLVNHPITTENPFQEHLETAGKLYPGYLYDQPQLVKAAVGMDFFDVSVWGKLFRIIQYLTQALIIIGAIYILVKRLKWPAEFIYGIGVSFGFLLACIFVLEFSNLINITRFYHFSLFFLAPLLVLWGKKWLVPLVLCVYFIFTSGLVYEVVSADEMRVMDVPYSFALAAERTGIIGVYNQDDVNCAEWLTYQSDKKLMTIGDTNGYYLLASYIELYPRLKYRPFTYRPTWFTLPEHCYIFTLTWNNEKRKFINEEDTCGTGLRGTYDLPEFKYKIVYQSGNCIVYEK